MTEATKMTPEQLLLKQRCGEPDSPADIAWDQHRLALLHVDTCAVTVKKAIYTEPAESNLLCAIYAAIRSGEPDCGRVPNNCGRRSPFLKGCVKQCRKRHCFTLSTTWNSPATGLSDDSFGAQS